jgi:hypothetical protein
MRRWSLMLALCVLALAACGGDSPPTVGTNTAFSDVCAKANDGKRIAVDGYLRFPDSFTDDGSVILRLYQSDAFQGDTIGVQTEFGTQPNQVAKVENQYTDADLKVYQASGQVVTYGTKVRVSGTVYFPTIAQEFACSLENPLVATAP